jgi:hypothetical protein
VKLGARNVKGNPACGDRTRNLVQANIKVYNKTGYYEALFLFAANLKQK